MKVSAARSFSALSWLALAIQRYVSQWNRPFWTDERMVAHGVVESLSCFGSQYLPDPADHGSRLSLVVCQEGIHRQFRRHDFMLCESGQPGTAVLCSQYRYSGRAGLVFRQEVSSVLPYAAPHKRPSPKPVQRSDDTPAVNGAVTIKILGHFHQRSYELHLRLPAGHRAPMTGPCLHGASQHCNRRPNP